MEDSNMTNHDKIYYIMQLDKLKNSIFQHSLIIYDGVGNKTKTMNINNESIPILIKWLLDQLEID